jgi:MscS family membrane protein
MEFQSVYVSTLTKDMKTWNSPEAFILREWIFALCIFAGTLILATGVRLFLKRLHNDWKWQPLLQLAPTLSNLIYIIGLRLAVELAPLSERAEIWVDNAIYILAIIIILRLIQRAALLGITWSTLKSSNSQALHLGFIPLLRNVVTLFVFMTGGIMILKHFDYDVMSLVTALGVGSLAVGLAAKDTLSNMISGFIIIIDRNLRPGDRVNLNGAIGDVVEVGLRSTQIQTGDGNTLIVPNAELVNTKILNLSMPSRELSCTVSIRVPFSIPFSEVKEICLNILNQMNKLSRKRQSWVNLVSLSEGYQSIQIGFWVLDLNDSGGAISEFNERLLREFEERKMSLLLQGGTPT